MNWGDRSLRVKLSLTIVLTIVVVLALFGFGANLYLRHITELQAKEELVRQNALVRDMIASADESMRIPAVRTARIFETSLQGKTFSRDDGTKVQTGARETVTLKMNDAVVNNHFDEVDAFSSMTDGSPATLFVKDGDDFVRAATSVKDEKGGRAVGTVLDRNGAAYAALRDGKSMVGRAVLFGKDYVAVYRPLKDASDAVIGASFVGIDVSEAMANLKKRIREIKVGSSGYVFVVDGREGPAKGNVIVHPAKEGQNFLAAKDSSGREFIRELIERKNGILYYDWQNAERGESAPEKKIVAFANYKDWGWVIGSGSYLSEFVTVADMLSNKVVYSIVLVSILISLVLNLSLDRLAVRPLRSLQDVMLAIGRTHDFSVRVPVSSADEIGTTAKTFNGFIDQIRTSLCKVAEDAREVASASEELSRTAEQVSASSINQSEASASVAATIEEMTVSVNHVGDRAGEALRLSREAGELAVSGSATIGKTIQDIKEISAAVADTSRTIRELENRTEQVSGVVQLIREVAEQTNLLALNAAIEAARAGEAGRGFAVVADEVRKLAERTTRSTHEISENIDVMRAEAVAASGKIQETESLVNNSVARADMADQAIRQIGGAAGAAAGAVTQISDAIREQAAASTSIALQVERIAKMSEAASDGAQHVAASATNLDKHASDQMAELAQYRF